MSARNSKSFDMFDATDTRHGTQNGYNNHGCRCIRCRTAQNTAAAIRRATRPSIPFISKAEPLPVTADTITVGLMVTARFPDEPHLLAMLGITA